jgi:hypothetical protein
VLSGATPDTAAAVSSAHSTQVDTLTADFGYDPGLACAPVLPAPTPSAVAARPLVGPGLPVVRPAPLPQSPPSLPSSSAVTALVGQPAPTALPPASDAVAAAPTLHAPVVGPPTLDVLAPAPPRHPRTAAARTAAVAGASTPTLEVPLLPCTRVPPPESPWQAHDPAPGRPPARVPMVHPPQAAVGVPVEPPLSPAGPAPAPAPAPQPQPGPANQAQAQQQVSSQTQPGLQAGLAAAPDPALRQARAYAASRTSSPYPSTVLLWAWTFALVSLGGALAARQRTLRPARSRVWGG